MSDGASQAYTDMRREREAAEDLAAKPFELDASSKKPIFYTTTHSLGHEQIGEILRRALKAPDHATIRFIRDGSDLRDLDLLHIEVSYGSALQ